MHRRLSDTVHLALTRTSLISMSQVALEQLLQDSRLYEPLTPLRLRDGNEAWPAAVEAMVEHLLSCKVCLCRCLKDPFKQTGTLSIGPVYENSTHNGAGACLLL